MSKVLYYVVNGNGQGVISTSYPVRDEKRKIWLGTIEGVYIRLVMQMESEGLVSLPVMKWSDGPIKIELNLEVCSERPR